MRSIQLTGGRVWIFADRDVPARIETLIVRLTGEKPHRGGHKIRELPVGRLDGEVRGPKQFQCLSANSRSRFDNHWM